MRWPGSIVASGLLLLAACGGGGENWASTANEAENADRPGDAPGGSGVAGPGASGGSASGWNLQAGGDGATLLLASGSGEAAIRLICPAGGGRLVVNVPGFRPVGSEERLSFGGRGEAVALVAGTAGDRRRGGVSGEGAVPAALGAILAGPVSASYGVQSSGPHPAPPSSLANAFLSACRGRSSPPPRGDPPPSPPPASGSPCLVQDGKRLDVKPLRALGNEPFWGARIEGRCVTYSHPDDQKGTRVWTRYTQAAGGGLWEGALGGRRFALRTRAQPGCSDGMSDNVYPIAVELVVNGETRRGCAEPL